VPKLASIFGLLELQTIPCQGHIVGMALWPPNIETGGSVKFMRPSRTRVNVVMFCCADAHCEANLKKLYNNRVNMGKGKHRVHQSQGWKNQSLVQNTSYVYPILKGLVHNQGGDRSTCRVTDNSSEYRRE